MNLEAMLSILIIPPPEAPPPVPIIPEDTKKGVSRRTIAVKKGSRLPLI